eukprot:gene2671-1669_t
MQLPIAQRLMYIIYPDHGHKLLKLSINYKIKYTTHELSSKILTNLNFPTNHHIHASANTNPEI